MTFYYSYANIFIAQEILILKSTLVVLRKHPDPKGGSRMFKLIIANFLFFCGYDDSAYKLALKTDPTTWSGRKAWSLCDRMIAELVTEADRLFREQEEIEETITEYERLRDKYPGNLYSLESIEAK